MEYKKTVYVKNFTTGLNNVTSLMDGEHECVYPIYIITLIDNPFTKDNIKKWHPKAEYLDGRALTSFKIGEVVFSVEDQGNHIIIATEFEDYLYQKNIGLNTLSLFQKFGYSFFITNLRKQFDEGDFKYSNWVFETKDNRKDYDLVFELDRYSMVLKYKLTDDGYEYIGTAYNGIETWSSWQHNIDFEQEIQWLKDKKEYAEKARKEIQKMCGFGIFGIKK